MTKVIHIIIKGIIGHLVNGEYEKVLENDYKKIPSLKELKKAIEDYPGHMTVPPASAYNTIDTYKRSENDYQVDFGLWYDNKRSDLTMICNIKMINNDYRYSIEDILVQ